MKKQVLFFLLMFMPLVVSAYDVVINGIYYNLNQETKQATVTKNGSQPYSGNVVIPKTLSYEGVTYSISSIGEYAFQACHNLTSVVISNSVTSIGDHAFIGCSSLTSVEIPNSVTSIGDEVFFGCSNLTFISVEDGNTIYDSRHDCNAVVKTFNNELIIGCKSTIIPNSVTSIGDYAFCGCSSLTSVEIPNSVTNIGDYAFSHCSSLTSVEIPNSVTIIGCETFSHCSSLTSVEIPNSITKIKGVAFCGCSSLTSIVIPNSVTSIGMQAFQSCYSLTSIEIPNSVTSIGDQVFSGCSGLTSVKISNRITSISNSAFSGCSSLTSVEIPNSVTSICNYAFQGCTSLTSIEFPNSVTGIGMYAFGSCFSLTSIEIPNSVTNISYWAFINCCGLKRITIGSGVKDIHEGAFIGINNLTEVNCLAKNVPSANEPDVFNRTNIENCTLYVPESSIDSYRSTYPWSGFGTIKAYRKPVSFTDNIVKELCVTNWDSDGNGELSEDEAATVTDLGSVFAENTDITTFDELQYFTGLTSIGDSAFYYCSNLASITIPDNVNTIGNRAFYVCSGLKSLQLSANVTSIEDRAFAYCSGLESIVVDAGNTVYDSRDNCNALIKTSNNTLLVGCKNTIIPSSVKVIAEGAFRGCTELTSMEIPEGVTTIGASAFRGCTGLESVTLPSTITSIGTYAFSAVDEVYNLTSVTVGMTTPVAITANVFPNRANSTLYVPKGSMAAYKAANYWKEFKNIVELENGVPVKCEKPVITLLANGKVKVESATEGATCITNITASNAEPLTDGEISLNTPLTIYTVTSYATAEGYEDSEVATATFRYEKAEGDMNGDGVVNISDVIQLVNMILGQ